MVSQRNQRKRPRDEDPALSDEELTVRLRDAIWEENLSKVKRLLAKRADVNDYSQNNRIGLEPYFSPLHCGYNKDGDHVFGTALHAAGDISDIDIVKLLLREKADPQKSLLIGQETTKHLLQAPGSTALHYAVFKSNLSLVDELLDAKAMMNAKNINHQTPLTIAIDTGYEQIVQRLLDRNAKMSDETLPPLVKAVSLNNLGLVQKLIAAKADLEQCSDMDTPLTGAIWMAKKGEGGQLEDIVWALCQAKADPNGENPNCETPLEVAINSYYPLNLRITQILLEAKADGRSIEGDLSGRLAKIIYTPLKRLFEIYLAPEKLSTPSVSKPMGAGFHPTSKSEITELTAALHQAIWEDDFPRVHTLLEKKADVTQYHPYIFKKLNHTQPTGRPLPEAQPPSPYDLSFQELQEKAQGDDIYGNALHAAAGTSDIRIVQALLKAPGQTTLSLTAPLRRVYRTTGEYSFLANYSAVYLAAMQSNISMIDILVAKRIDINHVDARNDVEETPLIMAARHGNNRVVRHLLDKKADPNQVDSHKRTPLLTAVETGNIVSINMLIAANAHIDTLAPSRDLSLTTPLREAVSRGNLNMVTALCDAKADPNVFIPLYSPLYTAVDRLGWILERNGGRFDRNIDNCMEITKKLLALKAKPFVVDDTGREVSVVSIMQYLPASPQKFALIRLLERHQKKLIAKNFLLGTIQRPGHRSPLFRIATRSSLFDPQVLRLPLKLGAHSVIPRVAEDLDSDDEATEKRLTDSKMTSR